MSRVAIPKTEPRPSDKPNPLQAKVDRVEVLRRKGWQVRTAEETVELRGLRDDIGF